MPGLSNWLDRRTASAPVPGSALNTSTSTYYPQPQDPNTPDRRLEIASKCIYERQMPGGSYITTHIERLQSGYYDSPVVHEDCISNVRFVALRFVFHEASTERRFKAATIRITLLDDRLRPQGIPLPPQLDHPDDSISPVEKPRPKPKFLKYSPHLLYGAMSPESLDWNFNLAGSLGTVQAPVSASVNPSYGIKSSYKVYKMMKIQGSLRTNSSWHGKYYDVDDGELVWTLEENELQKSGLPREFTFVMMLTKGDVSNDVRLEIDVEPQVASWFGSYPQWWVHLLKYQPLYKDPLDLDKEVGQRFAPCDRNAGYNFAGLTSTFDKFVTMPGTMYSAQDWSVTQTSPPTTSSPTNTSQQKQQKQPSTWTQSPTQMKAGDESTPSNTVHLRIHLDQAHKQGPAISASYASPVSASASASAPTSKQRQSPPIKPRSPSASTTPPGKPATINEATPNKSATTTRSTGPISRRLTINGTTSKPTPPKYKLSRVPPLQTHFEEHTPSPPKLKPPSSDEETDHDYEYSFPEFIYTTPNPPAQSISASSSNHRHTKSTSTSSSTGVLPKTSPPISGPPPTQSEPQSQPQPSPMTQSQPQPSSQPKLQTQHSLRRSRSRSSLRRSISLSSSHEDEQAISAAMDMLSGSPPPPAPAPPASAPPMFSVPRKPHPQTVASQTPTEDDADDIVLATPRTRAALADLLEVERAEKARVQRRNGNSNAAVAEGASIRQPPLVVSDRARAKDDSSMRGGYSSGITSNRSSGGMAGGTSSGNSQLSLSDQERRRQKRYSMPVTSSGIGYPGTAAAVASSAQASGGGSGSGSGSSGGGSGLNGTDTSDTVATMMPVAAAANATGRSRGPETGHGRSSLMIPIGSKRDSGLGIGIATGTPEANTKSDAREGANGSAGRSGFSRRDHSSGIYSGYDYVD